MIENNGFNVINETFKQEYLQAGYITDQYFDWFKANNRTIQKLKNVDEYAELSEAYVMTSKALQEQINMDQVKRNVVLEFECNGQYDLIKLFEDSNEFIKFKMINENKEYYANKYGNLLDDPYMITEDVDDPDDDMFFDDDDDQDSVKPVETDGDMFFDDNDTVEQSSSSDDDITFDDDIFTDDDQDPVLADDTVTDDDTVFDDDMSQVQADDVVDNSSNDLFDELNDAVAELDDPNDKPVATATSTRTQRIQASQDNKDQLEDGISTDPDDLVEMGMDPNDIDLTELLSNDLVGSLDDELEDVDIDDTEDVGSTFDELRDKFYAHNIVRQMKDNNILHYIETIYEKLVEENLNTKVFNPLSLVGVTRCTNLDGVLAFKKIPFTDLSKWDTGGVRSMRGMFYNTDFRNKSILNWDFSGIDYNRGHVSARPTGVPGGIRQHHSSFKVDGLYAMFLCSTFPYDEINLNNTLKSKIVLHAEDVDNYDSVTTKNQAKSDFDKVDIGKWNPDDIINH